MNDDEIWNLYKICWACWYDLGVENCECNREEITQEKYDQLMEFLKNSKGHNARHSEE